MWDDFVDALGTVTDTIMDGADEAGAVAGGIVGFVYGGPIGAIAGAKVGYALGGASQRFYEDLKDDPSASGLWDAFASVPEDVLDDVLATFVTLEESEPEARLSDEPELA